MAAQQPPQAAVMVPMVEQPHTLQRRAGRLALSVAVLSGIGLLSGPSLFTIVSLVTAVLAYKVSIGTRLST